MVETGTLIYNHQVIRWYELGYKTNNNGNRKIDTLVVDGDGLPIFREWLFKATLKDSIVNRLEKMMEE